MGEGFDRILGAAETLILHRCGDPDQLLPRAGQRLTFKRRVGFSERGIGRGSREYATGAGYLAIDEELKIHPNAVKELPRGECFVIAGGQYQRVLVKRAPLITEPQPGAPTLTAAHNPPPIAVPLTQAVIEVERTPIAPAPAAPAAPASEPEMSVPPPSAYADEEPM
jgi:hypothetical protein